MRHRLPLLALLSSATLLSQVACNDKEHDVSVQAKAGAGGTAGGAGRGGTAGAGGGKVIGKPDTPSSTKVGVDEGSLRGSVVGSDLELRFRAKAGFVAAKGTLALSLRSVDDASGGATVDVPYDLPAGGEAELVAKVALPASLASLEARVATNVVLEGDGVRVTHSLFHVLAPLEITLDGPSALVTGKPSKVAARVRHPLTFAPVAGAPVTLTIRREGAVVGTSNAVSDSRGDAIFDVALDTPGSHELSAGTTTEGTPVDIAAPLVARAPGSKLLLTTDKPIYQPGQAMFLRALALAESGNTPLANQPVLFEVKDGKGNKVFKRTLTSDAYGIAAATFRLGSVVNTGTYKITTQVGTQTSEKTVSVGAYALPKFRAVIATDRGYYGPGDVVTGTIDAAYFFGKLVAGGDVTLEAATLDVGENVFQTVQGKLDPSGHFGFSVTLPPVLAGLPLDEGKGLVVLRAKVKDTAGQEVVKEQVLTISKDGVDLALVPEATSFVPGLENRLDLYASDPLGAPIANTSVTINAFDVDHAVTTDADGHASVTVTPPDGAQTGETSASASVSLALPDGKTVQRSFAFGRQAGEEHVALRTDKSVYDVGETVQVSVRTTDPGAMVYVDWLAGGQVLDISSLQAKDGVATFSRTVDAGSIGGNRVEAYIVDLQGRIIRTGRSIVVRNKGALGIAVTTEKPSYLPGEQAKLTLTVTDETGKPAVAALGVQIVDEAVFALVDARPGLLRTYFELDRAFAEPSYEIHGPSGSFEEILYGGVGETDAGKQQAKQTKAGAALAALGNKTPGLTSSASWTKTLQGVSTVLAPFLAARRAALVAALAPTAKSTDAALQKEGCYPYGGTCKVAYQQVMKAALEPIAGGYDFWGNAYLVSIDGGTSVTVRSKGPDEQDKTADDQAFAIGANELGIADYWGGGEDGGGPFPGAGGGAAGGSTGSGPPPGTPSEPRVRKDFPETLLVAPAIITGADGKASLDVPLADSITTWRVSALANSASGKLGGNVGGIQVFTDFFTDIAFPAELTRGDEITFPVAVYNYLDVAQTVTLELSGGDWYTPLGPQSFTVQLAPGEVKGVDVPVRAEKVGVQALTVKAKGSAKADAVQRIVRVVPDGKPEAKAFSGALPQGVTTHTVNFPALAVPGSGTLRLDLYPASFSQIVSGIDSILQTPSGCFEQTTSTTWPNVLALKYMNATQQGTAEIRLKAETLINTGYQRLLTFEHPGGGFSWFGTQDKAPFLSVTAFGLMEFADMATVSSVDEAMIARTAGWLAGQQQADGSWKGDQTEFFSVNASTVRNTAFVTWSLASAGYQGGELDKALAYVKTHLGASDADGGDAYTIGVAANAFVMAAPNDPFTSEILAKLDGLKKVDGDKISWTSGGTQTGFYEGGSSADLSATALAGHAFLSASAYPSNVAGALAQLAASRDPQGNFGPTQSTVWSLRLLSLAATKGTESAVGTVDVAVDGAPFTTLSFDQTNGDVLRQVDLASLATTGDHQVTLSFVGTGKPSYSLVAGHHVPWASVPKEPTGPLSVDVAYDRTSLLVDETVETTVTLKNLEKVTQNMVHATLGVPPGFEIQGEDFEPELTSGQLSRWETTGKQLELYVPVLAPQATLVVTYRLRATMPIKAEDGGAKVFPYYQPDAKSTAPSTTLVATK